MSRLNSQLRFNADGTPRRRYELEQASEGKAVLATTIGLVLAGAAALVKNVLFPTRPLEQAPLPGHAASDNQAAPIESGIAHVEGDPLHMSFGDDGANAGLVAHPRSTPATYRSAPISLDHPASVNLLLRGGSQAASNDNNALYGAMPGHGVKLAASDTVQTFPSPGDGGGSRGQASRGSTDDDGLPPGPREGGHGVNGGEEGQDADDRAGTNRAPVVTAPVSFGMRLVNQVLVIGMLDLLVHASDANGDPLSVVNLSASSGTLVANADGGWNYLPDPGTPGDVTFSYAVSDGLASVRTTATLSLPEAVAASVPADSLAVARIGSGAAVTDVRDDFAESIAEKIMTGPTPIAGTAGDDVITGTQGNDVIFAGSGDDIVDGGDGDDIIHGDAGNDVLTGGKGRDTVSGDDGDDTIIATVGDGDDVYDGGDGDDTLDLTAIGPAEAVVSSPVPASAPAAAAEPVAVTVDCSAPEQSLDELAAVLAPTADVCVNLDEGTADGGLTGHDVILNIENVATGGGDDTIIGNGQDNKLDGGAGCDFISGQEGDDTLVGGAGHDVVDGGDGNDLIVADDDDATDGYHGGDGIDMIDVSAMNAGAFVDLNEGTLNGGGAEADTISQIENVVCGDGDDTIIANEDVSVFTGGLGDDLFVFQSSASIGYGSKGHDKIVDFDVGDKIDFSDISKEFAKQIDNLYEEQDIKDFVIISNLDTFSKAGQLKVVYDEDADSTSIYGNIDFDAEAEFQLELEGNHLISQSDFHYH